MILRSQKATLGHSIVVVRVVAAEYSDPLCQWEGYNLFVSHFKDVLIHTSKFFTGCFCVFVTETFQTSYQGRRSKCDYSVSRIFWILSFGRSSKLAASMGHSWSCFHDSLIEKPSLYLPTLSPFLRGRSSFSRNLFPILSYHMKLTVNIFAEETYPSFISM